MKLVRIAHVISAQELYGKEKWLLAFLKYLDRGAYSAIVIVLGDDERSRLSREVSKLGVSCHTIDARRTSILKVVRSVGAILRENDIRILHSHDYKSDVIGLWSARLSRCKTVCTPHGWSNERDPKLQFYQRIDKLIFPFFDKVAPLSKGLAESLRHLPGGKLELILNFMDVPDLDGGVPVRAKSVSCIGRLTPLKRFEDAVTALRYAKDTSYTLQLIGDGPERSKLESLTRDLDLQGRVSFLGFRDDAIELLRQSAILVHPSTTEGISRVVMEAMALGKVIIGTEIPGISILVKHGVTGMLVPPRNPKAIASALDWLSGNAAAGEQMGTAARRHIINEHSAQAAVKRYEALYSGMAAAGE